MTRWFGLLFLLLVACASGQTPVNGPDNPAPDGPREPKPVDGEPLPGQAEAIPPPPAECKAFSERKPAAAAACADAAAARAALADALSDSDAGSRDAKLLAVEACKDLVPGSVRALRAELAPVECADAIVEPLLEHPPVGLGGEVKDALSGLGLAARAARLVKNPPKLAPPHDKQRVQEFMQGPLKTWIEGQARAIEKVSLHGSNLEGYGKGVIAIEAGLADLRFVEVARNAPVPESIAKDAEMKEAYYVSLEQALEARKQRGRDAALVGLKKLAEAGVIADARVERARTLLSQLFSGRRIDALDSLLLPKPAGRENTTAEQKLAARLPSFYFGVLLPDADVTDPKLLGALVERGLPKPARAKLEGAKKLSAEAKPLFARGLFGLGQRYWRGGDFAAAEKLFVGGNTPDGKLYLALSRPLAGGPKDAVEMMSQGPLLPKGVADVAALDALGKDKGDAGGLALFDAARLLEIATPRDADAAYWKGIADRYQRASEKLTDASQKANALDRAKSATETANSIAAAPKKTK
jgi:hypothetical protein